MGDFVDTKNLYSLYDLYDSRNLYGTARNREMVFTRACPNMWIFPLDACASDYPKYVGEN